MYAAASGRDRSIAQGGGLAAHHYTGLSRVLSLEETLHADPDQGFRARTREF